MDKKYIDDNNIKRKYLRGLLTEDDCLQFESYLLDKPDLVEELELDEALFRLMPALEERRQSLGQKLWSVLDMPLRRVFAPLVVCLLVIPLGLASMLKQPGVSSIEPVFMSSDSYRSATDFQDTAETLTFQDDGQVKLVMLAPYNERAENFDVMVRDLSGRLIQQFEGRSRGDSRFISIELSALTIDEGEYMLEMTPSSNGQANGAAIRSEDVESFPFRVIHSY